MSTLLVALIASFSAYLCVIRYSFQKKGLLITGILITLMAIVDIAISDSLVSAGVAFGLLALLSSTLQLVSISMHFFVRAAIASFITLFFLVTAGDAASLSLMAAFIIARFAESVSSVTIMKMMLFLTHVIWLAYGVSISAYVIIMTQSLQMFMIIFVLLYEDRAVEFTRALMPKKVLGYSFH